MADEDTRLPDVQVYWKDRRDLYLALAAAALGPTLSFILALKRLPDGSYEWVCMLMTAAVAMLTVAKSRSLATPEHAGAMRFTSDAMKMLPQSTVDRIVTAAEVPRPEEQRGGDIKVTP